MQEPDHFDERQLHAWRALAKRVAARGWLLDEFKFPMQHAVTTFTTYADRHARGEMDAECEALRIEARRWAAEFLVLDESRVPTGVVDGQGFDVDLAQIYDWPPQEAGHA